jgi:hypothetical protein
VKREIARGNISLPEKNPAFCKNYPDGEASNGGTKVKARPEGSGGFPAREGCRYASRAEERTDEKKPVLLFGSNRHF